MEKDKVGDGEDDEADDDDEKMPSVTMMMKACKSVTAVLGAEVKLQKFPLSCSIASEYNSSKVYLL